MYIYILNCYNYIYLMYNYRYTCINMCMFERARV